MSHPAYKLLATESSGSSVHFQGGRKALTGWKDGRIYALRLFPNRIDVFAILDLGLKQILERDLIIG